ncbi:GNAT family protein [Actinocorallia sp. A-T 12471]|uniref:GNAT family N-acetyltransferase n=1 Tax=Actinocorallia sp. A-T 12471 TaxID=3089813 RepID=UPI0029D308FB|nr:GNAT family protein [Actinocorallia sp. A-T 12471]MDX6742861.1 GNAT family protein [Actinocorallia sp. A-T 12471]
MASTLDDLTWPARTSRLLIRRSGADDIAPTWERYRHRESIRKWLSGGDHDFAAYTAKYDDPVRMSSTLIIEHDGEIVGDLMLRLGDVWAQAPESLQDRPRQAELGWCLSPEVQGRGFAYEAARELVRISFDGLGLHRVTAVCFTDNTPSWKLMEKLGMRRESHSRKDSLHSSGEWLDSYSYAMLAEEWRAQG